MNGVGRMEGGKVSKPRDQNNSQHQCLSIFVHRLRIIRYYNISLCKKKKKKKLIKLMNFEPFFFI
jgi:hypothetical protein